MCIRDRLLVECNELVSKGDDLHAVYICMYTIEVHGGMYVSFFGNHRRLCCLTRLSTKQIDTNGYLVCGIIQVHAYVHGCGDRKKNT